MNTEEQFLDWLSANVAPSRLQDYYMAMENVKTFADQKGIIRGSLYDVTDSSISDWIVQALSADHAYKFTHSFQWRDTLEAAKMFHKYIIRKQEEHTTAVNPISQESVDGPHSNDDLRVQEKVVAEETVGNLRVNFMEDTDYTATKPVSISYFGNQKLVFAWPNAYRKICAFLYDDYPMKFRELASEDVPKQYGRIVYGKECVGQLLKPKEIANGYYIELCKGANGIVASIKSLLEYCAVDYENLEIIYQSSCAKSANKSMNKGTGTSQSQGTSMVAGGYDLDWESEFRQWLERINGKAIADGLFSEMRFIDEYAQRNRYTQKSFFVMEDYQTVKSVRNQLEVDPDFERYSQYRGNRPHDVLRKYDFFRLNHAKNLKNHDATTTAQRENVSETHGCGHVNAKEMQRSNLPNAQETRRSNELRMTETQSDGHPNASHALEAQKHEPKQVADDALAQKDKRPRQMEFDMQIRNVSPDASFEERVFAEYPLIGSKIIKPETLKKLEVNAITYIDSTLWQRHYELTLRAEMQIALAIINIAKDWNSDENSHFWNYIMLQLGYRYENGTVLKILQTSLEHAMKRNGRLFIEDTDGRELKLTAVMHAFSTRKSWMAVLDFLFDFYKNNLNWRVIPDDSMLDKLIGILQKKITGESVDDGEITVSSRIYSFHAGIRKLILLRPEFTRELFEKLLNKIDSMINSEDIPVKSYEEQLCEEWFKEKITTISNTIRSGCQKTDAQREVAVDYSRISVKYALKDENIVQLVLPDIRLKREDVQRTILSVFYDEAEAFRQNLNWYGNELGKTLMGTSVMLPEYTGGNDAINIRVKIICDDEVIFDSESSLFRRVMMFASGREVHLPQMRSGNYTLVMPSTSHLQVEHIDITVINSFRPVGLKAYFLELHDGYMLTIDGELLAFDSGNGTDIRVYPPSESAFLPKVSMGDVVCYLAYRGSTCTIILGDANYTQRFIVMKNGKRVDFSELEDAGNGLAFICPLSDEKDICRIQVVNLDNERLVFDSSFLLATETECGFNREFYFDESDYIGALFSVKIDDFSEKVAFTSDSDEIRIPFRNGELHADIPKVRIHETTGEWLNGRAFAWFVGDIPQNSLLQVDNPSGTSVHFYVGGKDIMYRDTGIATLGNFIQSISGTDGIGIAPVEMSVSGRKQDQRYTLARICFKECFLRKPEFWYSEGKLFWNQGGTFVGKRERIFTLLLSGEKGNTYEFELNVEDDSIDLPENIPIGNYKFEISILAGGLFKKAKEILGEGECIIGDQNLLRFKGRRIKIDAITDEFEEDAGHIKINPCYIDQIKFKGVEDTSEGICPVYEGVLYTESNNGSRYIFSFKKYINRKGIAKMKMNPVRIVYIGESALCITDSEGDGLYYYHYYDQYSQSKVYALTDHEYTKASKNKYSTADLYSYETERI